MIVRLWRILRGWFMAKRLPGPAIAHRERMEAIDKEHRDALWVFDCELHPVLAITAPWQNAAQNSFHDYQNQQANCAALYQGIANAYNQQSLGSAYQNQLNQAAQMGPLNAQDQAAQLGPYCGTAVSGDSIWAVLGIKP